MAAKFFRGNQIDFGANRLEFTLKLIVKKMNQFISELVIQRQGLHGNHLFKKRQSFGELLPAVLKDILHVQKSIVYNPDAMKLAILGTRGIPASYGGFETFAEELSTRLAARGHDVTVYCRS